MNQKILSKVLATMLAVILTFTNFVMLGVYATNTYATEDQLENQKIVSNNENVKFDAYFIDANGSKIHTSKQDIDANLKLYLAIQVEKGYLKNAKVGMLGKDGGQVNFKIINNNETLDTVESIDADNNVIALKQINSGTDVILEIPISSIKTDIFDLSNFSKINDITLTGTYIDNAGKQVIIEKTINIRNEWTKEVTVSLEQSTKSFIPYEVNDKKETMLQTIIKTGLENNSLPIKQTKISIEVPKINDKKPDEVIVVANTYATNNQETDNFTNQNWNYDKDTGIIDITVSNEPNENKVKWNRTSKDEYTITYIYSEKVNSVEAVETAKVEIEAYNNEVTKVEKENTLNINQSEKLGNIVTTQITANNELSKGYLYSNVEKETEYVENIKLDIGYANIVDNIIVENDIENFITSNGEQIPTTNANKNYTYFKTTIINKEDFKQILGEDGYIKIIGRDGEQLAFITLEEDENQKPNTQSSEIVYTYSKEINKIKIETSKPIKEGILEIKNVKSLKGKTDFSKAQIIDFQKLQIKEVTSVEYANTVIESAEASRDVTLIAPSTKIEASVNKQNLSTIVKNENVEFRVVLKTNDISCDLYKNPVVEIVLPNYIDDLNLKEVYPVFDDELKIKSYDKYINNNGNYVIKVTLEGEQTAYIQNEISKGENIVINTDITIKKLSPTKDDVAKVYITNQNVTSYENTESSNTRGSQEKGFVEIPLKAVAPTGVVTTNSISGYNSKNETVISVSGEEQVGKLDAKSTLKDAKVEISIINNYENKINNIRILGRFPKEGNKDPYTKVDLGSNFDATLAGLIKVSNANDNFKVYYSTNPEATKDLSNSENGWTTNVSDPSNTQSYLVVFDNYEMQTGDILNLEYKIQIPENLEYDKSIFANYVVFFDNVKETETIEDKQLATKIGLSTGEGPHLQVVIRNDRQGEIEEGTIITYTISVKNTGNETINNALITGNVPEGTIYIYYDGIPNSEDIVTKEYDKRKKEYSQIIEKIEPNEVKTITYQVEVDTLKDELSKQIIANGTVKVENYDAEFKSQVLENTIIQGYLKTELEMQPSYENKKEGQSFDYILKITNVNDKEKENVVVTDILPEGVSFVSATKNGIYNKDTNTVTWNLGTIEEKATEIIVLNVKINELQNNQSRKYITNFMNIKTSEKELKTNEVTFNISKPILAITLESSTSEKVVAGDIIEYSVTIKNVGETVANNVVLRDYMPDGLKYRGATYIIDGKKIESWVGNDDATINISSIKAKETVDVLIKVLVDDIEKNKTERKISNVVILSADGLSADIASNEVSHTIVEKAITDDPSMDEPEDGTYKISGLVWLDSNGNGRRDEGESTFGDIPVMLVDSTTGKIVKDPVTGINKEQNTNEDGIYTFANLRPGKYLVVFFYDTENYGITKYKVDGVIDSKNSDVISMKVTLKGNTCTAGVANSINIENSDATNIDMGLVVKAKFDLKLNKSVSKIIVNNSKGAKEYTYNNAKLAKVDLQEKTIDGTIVLVEYKITVTNEGEVAGYAKKIVDYMPTDMTFTSELNKDWYAGESGNLYNSSLANTLINPGETKELTLTLTKKMTSENTGTINNVAEIYEASNDYGIEDVDSKPANKVQNEDDISLADVIIGVKTGEVYVYIAITFISTIILATGIYFINKKVLGRI